MDKYALKENFHLYLISDATGETILSAARAVCAQYKPLMAIEHVYNFVHSRERCEEILKEIEKNPGIVLFTLLDENLAKKIKEFCKKRLLPCVDILKPILASFETYLHLPANKKVSAQHDLDESYYKKMEALDYALYNDDGQRQEKLKDADIILVGVSRTSKTPTSIYLANKGIKVANIPIIPHLPLSKYLYDLAEKKFIVGLIISSERLVNIRKNRLLGDKRLLNNYLDKNFIIEELNYAKNLCQKYNWPVIDVSRRAIEETAACILALYKEFKQKTSQAYE